MEHINQLAIGNTIPDITFFIDIPVEEAESRKMLKDNNNLDRIEVSNLEFFQRVREGYLFLAQKEKRFRIINGTEGVEDIHKSIVKEIALLEKKELS